MAQNPFNISFGKEPLKNLSRQNIIQDVQNVFNNDNPETESFILTGPRGCGKTVLLSQLKSTFEEEKNWLVVDINPCMEMHEQLAARIYESGKMKKLFLKTEFSFSFKGFSFSISGDENVSDTNTLLRKMFLYLKKKRIKVLVTIDDISKNDYVKAFAHSFQSFIREKFDIFFIATGIYNNVSSLSSDKALTFLLRTPKILVEPLNLRSIALSYKDIFSIDINSAIELSKITAGYAFAYQLLGSLIFKSNQTKITNKIIDDFDLILEDRVYAQIWKELSHKEKEILIQLAKYEGISNSELATNLGVKTNYLEVYKKQLTFSGLVNIEERGKMKLSLPRFKEFVLFRIAL